MRKKFNEKTIMEKIIADSTFYKDEANEICMEYRPQSEKGAFEMSAFNLDSIIVSVAKMPLSAGQKEVVRLRITEKAQKLAVEQQVFNRVGFKDGSIYIDRGADGVTKVTADTIIKKVKKSSAPFRKNKTMRGLPTPDLSNKVPIRDGLKKLKRLINVANAEFMCNSSDLI